MLRIWNETFHTNVYLNFKFKFSLIVFYQSLSW